MRDAIEVSQGPHLPFPDQHFYENEKRIKSNPILSAHLKVSCTPLVTELPKNGAAVE